MKHFILIHGSWHGAWCWFKIAPRLRQEGHSVCVPDLPGRGAKRAPGIVVGTEQMISCIERLMPRDGKSVIVVHSRYGVLASELAQRFPDRIERVIYLASYMLPNGSSAADYFRFDTKSLLLPFVRVNKLALRDRLSPEIYFDGLYHDCSSEELELASALLVPEPIRPALKKIRLTEDRFGQVPRGYIRLLEDRAVTLDLQDKCLSETPVDRVEDLRTSHSAYFSAPDDLTQKILKIVGP